MQFIYLIDTYHFIIHEIKIHAKKYVSPLLRDLFLSKKYMDRTAFTEK